MSINLGQAKDYAYHVIADTMEKHWPERDRRVRIVWNTRLTSTAGRATFTANLIELSAVILPHAGVEAIQRTAIHELAHIKQRELETRRSQPHGIEWQRIMRKFGRDPSLCHEYFAMPDVIRGMAMPVIACERCDFLRGVSKQRAKKWGRGRVTHRDCGGSIRLLDHAERRAALELV